MLLTRIVKMIYNPEEDSFLLLKHVKEYAKGKVLDVGTGSGILAEEALKYTKDVLAVDINEESIKLCKGKNINAIKSDLFSNVNERFDLIIFNPPYLPEDRLEDEETKRTVSGGKAGYELIERFIKESGNYLNNSGKILLLFSSLTNKKKIDSLIKNNNFKFILLEKEKLFFEELYVYLIY